MSNVFDFAALGDLGNVDTSYPVLEAGLVNVTVVSAETVDNKAKDGSNLKLVLATVNPQNNIPNPKTGAVVVQNPGLKITSYTGLKATDTYPSESIAKSLAKLQECFLGAKTGVFDPSTLVGQTGSIILKVTGTPVDEFGVRNEISQFVSKAS